MLFLYIWLGINIIGAIWIFMWQRYYKDWIGFLIFPIFEDWFHSRGIPHWLRDCLTFLFCIIMLPFLVCYYAAWICIATVITIQAVIAERKYEKMNKTKKK